LSCGGGEGGKRSFCRKKRGGIPYLEPWEFQGKEKELETIWWRLEKGGGPSLCGVKRDEKRGGLFRKTPKKGEMKGKRKKKKVSRLLTPPKKKNVKPISAQEKKRKKGGGKRGKKKIRLKKKKGSPPVPFPGTETGKDQEEQSTVAT